MFSIQVLFDSSGRQGYVVCIVFETNDLLEPRSRRGDNGDGRLEGGGARILHGRWNIIVWRAAGTSLRRPLSRHTLY